MRLAGDSRPSVGRVAIVAGAGSGSGRVVGVVRGGYGRDGVSNGGYAVNDIDGLVFMLCLPPTLLLFALAGYMIEMSGLGYLVGEWFIDVLRRLWR